MDEHQHEQIRRTETRLARVVRALDDLVDEIETVSGELAELRDLDMDRTRGLALVGPAS